MALKTKLKQAFAAAFPGSKLELEPSSPGSKKVMCFLIWDKFVGKPQLDRQEKVWDLLEKKFTVEERAKITAILTTTPEEMSVARGH